MTTSKLLSTLILLLASWLGLWAFIYPFFLPQVEQSIMGRMGMAHAHDAPLIFILLMGLCLLVIIANLETRQMDARLVAMLGVLVGINATLRLIPGPWGFSAVFFLPILCGYVFGADFGFLMGALSLLVSGIITGAVGPWLPFQMFAAGWVGLVGGWLPHFDHRPRAEVLLLAGWGLLSGFLYGVIMNLWFWPYLATPVESAPSGESAMYWDTQIGFWSTLIRYIVFYLTTSLWWDAGRAIGNLLLILLVGAPIRKLLYRFKQRFRFSRI